MGEMIAIMVCAYGLAFLMELGRARGWHVSTRLIGGLLVLGLIVHTGWLIYRIALFQEQVELGGHVLSIRQDWYYGIAWGLALICLFWMIIRPATPFGVFFLPLILLLIVLGVVWGDTVPFARGAASRSWGIIHGFSILTAILAVCVALLSGVMYLGQVYRLKRRAIATSRFRLPSLEWLHNVTKNALFVAVAMLAVGIFSGLWLNVVQYSTLQGHLPWNDPVVLSTWILFFWLGGSLLLGFVYRPLREGRRVVYLTIVSFVFMLLVLGMTLFGATRHGQQRELPDGGLPVKSTQWQGMDPWKYLGKKRAFCLKSSAVSLMPEPGMSRKSGFLNCKKTQGYSATGTQ
ncbi:MAG: hypothetical protein WBH86_16550 [Thermogutta sp.]|nr:hypothetical protein [Thermogutta sp.]HOP76321.1 hypothetical protein [Thermogutta sp.]HQF12676.1 hypothetical protein [Thermogutta sp.]